MDSIERPGARFGATLRRLRQSRALSQESLAERSGLSVRGVSDLERGLKARPHLETVRLLADGLELDEPERAALISAARPASPPAVPGPERVPTYASTIIGRDAATAAAIALLAQSSCRLLTLTGPGGVGKTRLAIHLATEIAKDERTSVVFVPLATIDSADRILPAVASAMGLEASSPDAIPTLISNSYDQRPVLLVLDNLEHIRDAATPVRRLLDAAPSLKMLVTSRSPLRLASEQLFPVPPLARPAGQRIDADEIPRMASVRLFVERARAVEPDFEITPDNAVLIGRICDRLEGLPLAIELAARRVRLLSLPALYDLLETRLNVLAGGDADQMPRHRSLRGVIASSYELLGPDEQHLLNVAATFPAGSTIDALAETTGETNIGLLLGRIELLMDASMLQREMSSSGEPRFSMLESVREFAIEVTSETDRFRFRQALAEHFARLSEQAESELTQSRRVWWIARLEDEQPNIRVVLDWSIESDHRELAYRIGSSLWPFWSATGRLTEGAGWLERALSPDDDTDPAVRARALLRLGNLKVDQADYRAALACYTESRAISESIDDQRGSASALTGDGLVRVIHGEPEVAIAALERALALWRQLGNPRGEAIALMNLGNACAWAGEFEDARSKLEESLRVRQDLGDLAGTGYSLYALARLARLSGNRAAGRHLAIRSLRAFHASSDRPGFACGMFELGALARLERRDHHALAFHRVALKLREQIADIQAEIDSIEEIALIAGSNGQREAATTLLTFSSAWRARRHAPAHPLMAADLDSALNSAELSLSSEARAAANAHGTTISLSDAVAIAQSLVI